MKEIRRCFIFLNPVKNPMFTRNIHTFIRPTQWPHSVKHLCMCKIVCWKKAHGTNQNIYGFYTTTTQKGGFIKLCVKIKKDVIPTYSIFWPNSILTVELHHSFLYILFFQEKPLVDISFKLETKIMNFMSVFFEKNIIKTTQVLSVQAI